MRGEDGHDGARAGFQRRAAVEAEPADPQEPSADDRQRQIVRREIVRAVAAAFAHHQRRDEAGGAGAEMNHEAAGEIQRAGLRKEAAAPHPVGQRHIDQGEPADRKGEIGGEAQPISHSTSHQRHGDHRERHLIEREQGFGDRFRQRVDAGHVDTGQQPAIERTDPGSFADKGEAVAVDHPENRDHGDSRQTLGHGGEHVLLAHHAGVEQRQARHRHHQHQCGGDDHPRRVRCADGRCCCCWLCKRWCREQAESHGRCARRDDATRPRYEGRRGSGRSGLERCGRHGCPRKKR